MRIVIDMQGAQTESRFRGIGRYTMSFTKAVVENRGEHEVILALSGLFPETIEPIRAAFYDLLPQENIRVWYAPGPVCESQPDNQSRRETAEILREAFLASLEPDIIHIPSLFEGYLDDAVTSISCFDTDTPVSITLHDLIPLLNPKSYLNQNPYYKQHYTEKLDYVYQSTLCLSVSNNTVKEAIEALNLERNKVVNISSAIDPQFSQIPIEENIKTELYSKFGINQPFILYTGGSDDRKNLPRLVEAYATLPQELVDTHQLLLSGKMDGNAIQQLKQLAHSCGLAVNKLIFTNYINDEELIQLYNLCKLYVFPSWHEGFGLPALEAMACGAPVIAANTSSLPELIGLPEALFDPFDVRSISKKISQVLQDEEFRTYLYEHGLLRAKEFSWSKTASLAIQAWELLHHKHNLSTKFTDISSHKLRLAFVSPIPPERTGIADYSKDLLPALAKYYQIIIIVDQDQVDRVWVKNNKFEIQDIQWLKRNFNTLDRIIYQLGNSPFHKHMLHLIQEIPGIAVLHDFYMSDLMFWLETQAKVPYAWTKALYRSHGYKAIKERYQDVIKAKINYPVNFDIFEYAQGVIVHSNYSQKLSTEWYSNQVESRLKLVPHLRCLVEPYNKSSIRKKLGFTDEEYLVCSFGFLDPVKLNSRLLDCWLKSDLAHNENCYLIFVGENHGGSYGQDLLQVISYANQGKRIRITGFVDSQTFNQYLIAADVAVQLRGFSRGETSGAILHCMNHNLPVIVNAHGSLAELDRNAVWMLPDDFKDEELINALENLWHSPEYRHQLGDKAHQQILEFHRPDTCANLYAQAIEFFHKYPSSLLPRIIQKLTQQEYISLSTNTELLRLSTVLSENHPPPHPSKQLYLDITATKNYDLKSGIQRFARAITLSLVESAPTSYRIEPVYLSLEHGVWVYRYAREYTLSLIECPIDGLKDEVVEPSIGDILLQLDLSGDISICAERAGLFSSYRDRGVLVYATVFDLLPVLLPHVFPPGADQAHHQWLQMISKFDGAVCISKAVADDLRAWQDSQKIEWSQRRPYNLGWFHLGSDIFNSAPTQGLPDNSEAVLAKLKSCTTFLMVGTVEPRKAYMQVLDAFDALWEGGEDVNLVIVGHEGWKHIPDNIRRDIPQTVKRLRRHPKLNNNLFWLEGITDEYLEQVYAASTCLIAASYGEGFGLPLIEAARHKLPILARDIPVFREVAGDHACYFNSTDPDTLKIEILGWIQKLKSDSIPKSEAINFITWQDSASQLLNLLTH